MSPRPASHRSTGRSAASADGHDRRRSLRARTARLPASGGGVITRTTLPGGLRVITESMLGVRSASVGIWVPIGSRDESPSVAGASHFLEHLLFKGTATRTGLEIAHAMDSVGGEFNAFTEKEHTCYYATVLDRDLDLAIDLISDVVLDARIRSEDVDVERNVVLEEISMRDDDPSDLVHDEFASGLFGDTPLGRPILGSVDSIESLTRAQIHGYYRRRYQSKDMVVAVAGNVDHARVVERVRARFADRLDPAETASAPRAGQARFGLPQPVRVVNDDTEQANVILGSHGFSRHDDRRFVLGVLSAALGGGMSSRLFQAIREQRGLAYSVYSFGGSYADAGQFGVYAGCQPAKLNEVVSLMLRELDAVAAGGLSDDEVQRGKGQMRGGIVLGLEDAGSRMSRIGKSEICFADVLGVDDLLARVDSVTHAQVTELAQELLSRPRCLTVVGPFSENDFDGII